MYGVGVGTSATGAVQPKVTRASSTIKAVLFMFISEPQGQCWRLRRACTAFPLALSSCYSTGVASAPRRL